MISTMQPMQLQWGRDLIVAETSRLSTVNPGSEALQWGRDLIVAETCRVLVRPGEESYASMGPRLDSRGNSVRNAGMNSRKTASMGPRLDSRGNCPRRWRSCRWPRASMGPRLDSRGNSVTRKPGEGLRIASMGPRLDSRGNMGGDGEFELRDQLQWGRDLIVAETKARAARTQHPKSFNGAAT